MNADTSVPWRSIQICLIVITVILSAAALYWLRPVMIPFVLALLFMYGMAPVVDLLMKRGRFGKGLAITAALTLAAVVSVAVIALVNHSVQSLMQNADLYSARLNGMVGQVRGSLEGFGLSAQSLTDAIGNVPIPKLAGMLANEAIALVSNGFLVLIFLIYMLLGRTTTPSEDVGMRVQIETRIKRYIVVKVGLSAVTGVATTVILSLLSVELAVVFGLMAFFLNFIPNIGSVLATLLPVPVVLMDPSLSTTAMALAISLPGVVQLLVGNVVEPKIIGDSLELHPITVLLSLIVWGMLWGIVGMVLAAPLTAVFKIVADNFEITRPLAALMAGRLNVQVDGDERIDTSLKGSAAVDG
ncbi:MAG: AI-2 transport protein TqsA [Bradymonadia bacterium]|jgi:AI-2 transport protein TqsA